MGVDEPLHADMQNPEPGCTGFGQCAAWGSVWNDGKKVHCTASTSDCNFVFQFYKDNMHLNRNRKLDGSSE